MTTPAAPIACTVSEAGHVLAQAQYALACVRARLEVIGADTLIGKELTKLARRYTTAIDTLESIVALERSQRMTRAKTGADTAPEIAKKTGNDATTGYCQLDGLTLSYDKVGRPVITAKITIPYVDDFALLFTQSQAAQIDFHFRTKAALLPLFASP